jgi:hypothetical protein
MLSMYLLEALKQPLPRLPGATGDDPVIVGFLDELREAGRQRGLITEAHVAVIETVLANLCFAAGDDPGLVDLWDSVRALISDTSRSVKERLAGLDTLGDRWNEQHHGRAN